MHIFVFNSDFRAKFCSYLRFETRLAQNNMADGMGANSSKSEFDDDAFEGFLVHGQ